MLVNERCVPYSRQQLVRHLGGEPQEVLAKRPNQEKGVAATSHLICPQAEGPKYEAALKWGIPVVTKVGTGSLRYCGLVIGVVATSHLIYPQAEGPKYEATFKWCIPVVTKVR